MAKPVGARAFPPEAHQGAANRSPLWGGPARSIDHLPVVRGRQRPVVRPVGVAQFHQVRITTLQLVLLFGPDKRDEIRFLLVVRGS